MAVLIQVRPLSQDCKLMDLQHAAFLI